MCGIVAYLGEKEAAPILVEGLKKLEYRGYDSAGIAVNMDNEIEIIKEAGKLKELEGLLKVNPLTGSIGIGHTRWATHGRPSRRNSHPHYDCTKDFVIVHNGIIENFQHLKEELEKKGHKFISETDTEVIVHLLEEDYQGDLKEAVITLTKKLEGSYALAIMAKKEPNKVFALRQDSPLIVGLGENENFIASDIPAFLDYTNKFYILDDGEMAEVTKEEIKIYNTQGEKIQKDIFVVDWDPGMAEKDGYEHFMIKEIHEQPDALRRVLSNRISPQGINLKEINLSKEELEGFNKIYVVACGTAYYAGIMAKYVIEELSRVTVDVEIASEFRYSQPVIDEKTLVIVVSQSGETADTLAGLRLAQKEGAKVLALTNVIGSSIAREADEIFLLNAGPEIAVASTKAYITMITAFYLLGLYLADLKGTLVEERKQDLIKDMMRLPELAAETLKSTEEMIKRKAQDFKDKDNAFYIGRNTDYALSLEGALKLKEISYIHAEAYPAGELKHGPLALIEEGIAVVAIATRSSLYEKILSNIKEVKARGADVTAVAFQGDQEIVKAVDHVISIPRVNELFSGVLAVITLQSLAYYTAVAKGYDVDQPRNLAKSVTVE